MKKELIAIGAGLLLSACCHTYDLDVQGHQLTQVRTWDLIGPSTVGFYEDVEGKLHVYQDSSGNILGEVAQAVGTGYAGERIGDGIKHQEPDSTNISNDLESSAEGGYGEGGTAFGGTGIGGAGGDGGAGGAGGAGGRGGSAISGSISGAAAGAVSGSSSSSRSTSSSKPSSYHKK